MIIPFKKEQKTLICGNCLDEEGLFYIGNDFVAFCVHCTWTVKLESTPYPDLRELNDNQ